MEMLYVFVRIFEGISHGNIIHFCYYNSNRNNHNNRSNHNSNRGAGLI